MEFLNMMAYDSLNRQSAMDKAMTEGRHQTDASIAKMNQQVADSRNEMLISSERKRADEEKNRANSLAKSVSFYKNLLSKPMSEIAKYNDGFEKTFKIQQQNLSDWMLSQKAYKDLTYDLAFSLGLGEHETDKHYLNKVDEIVSGNNQNEKIIQGFEQYAKQSQANIHQVMQHKIAIQNGEMDVVDKTNPNHVKAVLGGPKPK